MENILIFDYFYLACKSKCGPKSKDDLDLATLLLTL